MRPALGPVKLTTAMSFARASVQSSCTSCFLHFWTTTEQHFVVTDHDLHSNQSQVSSIHSQRQEVTRRERLGTIDWAGPRDKGYDLRKVRMDLEVMQA